MKLTISKSKNSATFYVQKSIRKSNGSVSSVTIEKLGNLDQVRARANGVDPYQWAQEYVNELNRKEYEEQKSVMISRSPVKLMKKGDAHSFNCGYLFLQRIYYDLGLDKICRSIQEKYSFEYDLNEVLSILTYTRILYPSSKIAANQKARTFLEQPSFQLHDIYRALSVLSAESDLIQSRLYQNSQKILERRDDILYYDCTNYYFEIEQEDELRRYGKSKQHQPLPIVGMGLFMDADGIPLAFSIYLGNQNEQPTLKPLEQKVLNDYGMSQVVVCTDAGLSSVQNRKFNDRKLGNVRIRSFITTQSIKMLPSDLEGYALDATGWHLAGEEGVYDLNSLDDEKDYDKTFYKEKWITEDISQKSRRQGNAPLEQRLIVTFSLKYRNYQRKVREDQISRARKIIDSGSSGRKGKNQNDPNRFIAVDAITENGEVCAKKIPYLDETIISEEEKYDGFYAVCTNLENTPVSKIIQINHGRWEIEECFRIMKTEFQARPVYLQREDRIKAHFLTCYLALFIFRILEKRLDGKYTCGDIIRTLRNMKMYRPGEKLGYYPSYTRTDLTDALHEIAGFRTDYEVFTDAGMRKVIQASRKPVKKEKNNKM